MTHALAVSIKTRLRNIAREQGRLSQDLWRSLFIDRLLANPANLPQLFSDVLSEINRWLSECLGVSESHHSLPVIHHSQ